MFHQGSLYLEIPLFREYSRNFGQRSILARKGTFFEKSEKRAPKILPPPPLHTYSIPFLTVLHRNKSLYDFLQIRATLDSRTQYKSRICSAGSIKFPYLKNIILPTLKKM